MKQPWLIVAGVSVVVAAVLFLRGNFEAAFVVAAIGALTWFLNLRMNIKEQLPDNESKENSNEVSDE